jgi:uncharacterized membrane protein
MGKSDFFRGENRPYLLLLGLLVAYAASWLISAGTGFNLLVNVTGILFVLFAPGYALTLLLFRENHGIDAIAGFALGTTLSVVILIFDGLVLNFTTGINSVSTITSIYALTVLLSLLAVYRKAR